MKSWLDSKTIRFLFLTWLGGMFLQLAPMLSAHEIDWWALGSQSIATLAGILIRMAQPDVEAPLNVLNRPKQ